MHIHPEVVERLFIRIEEMKTFLCPAAAPLGLDVDTEAAGEITVLKLFLLPMHSGSS